MDNQYLFLSISVEILYL